MSHDIDPDGDVTLVLSRDSGQSEEDSVHSTDHEQPHAPDDEAVQSRSESFRVKVSSKHLKLASPVFKSMFRSEFKLGNELLLNGHAELPLPDDDPDALIILLKLIHCRLNEVPFEVYPPKLTKIAILVDKYDLQGVMGLQIDNWIKKSKQFIPKQLNEDLLEWICISWVFRKRDIFRQVTQIAQVCSEGYIEVGMLPIPEVVLKQIDKYRQTALDGIISYLKDTLEWYQREVPVCSRGRDCDAMILGRLIIELRQRNILPWPDPPYTGYSFRKLSSSLREMEIPSYCENRSSYHGRCQGMKPDLLRNLQEHEWQALGLNLGRTDCGTATVVVEEAFDVPDDYDGL